VFVLHFLRPVAVVLCASLEIFSDYRSGHVENQQECRRSIWGYTIVKGRSLLRGESVLQARVQGLISERHSQGWAFNWTQDLHVGHKSNLRLFVAYLFICFARIRRDVSAVNFDSRISNRICGWWHRKTTSQGASKPFSYHVPLLYFGRWACPL